MEFYNQRLEEKKQASTATPGMPSSEIKTMMYIVRLAAKDHFMRICSTHWQSFLEGQEEDKKRIPERALGGGWAPSDKTRELWKKTMSQSFPPLPSRPESVWTTCDKYWIILNVS